MLERQILVWILLVTGFLLGGGSVDKSLAGLLFCLTGGGLVDNCLAGLLFWLMETWLEWMLAVSWVISLGDQLVK